MNASEAETAMLEEEEEEDRCTEMSEVFLASSFVLATRGNASPPPSFSAS